MEYEGSTYLWAESRVGVTLYQPCPDNRTANEVTRHCLIGGIWTQPDTSDCTVASRVINDILNEGVSCRLMYVLQAYMNYLLSCLEIKYLANSLGLEGSFKLF